MYQATIRHLFVTAALLAFSVSAGNAQQRGVTDGEIRIGQTMPYSGALSAYSALGKAEIAYFNLVNEKGGINGRKIKLISLDHGYVPPKTVEQTRVATLVPIAARSGQKRGAGFFGTGAGHPREGRHSRHDQDAGSRLPGWPQQQGLLDDMASTVPLGRVGDPDDVAGAAVFLASSDASFFAGTELFIDGGQAQI
jgi:hypothetical protein